ncbi:MAG TPA: hypothetical protein VNM14_24385 [Planctomycetota bacterium]|nr:hypothetical protein [Planctomycetota bacterium]
MEHRWPDLLGEATRLLSSGEASRARVLFDQLRAAACSYDGGERRSLSGIWEPFLYLLGRRGYFVSGPAETRSALQEILEMGPGFDLFDLAVAVARCDRALARHLNAPMSRAFPELKSFCVEAE